MPNRFLNTVAVAKKLPANRLGQDYVIGDVHGMVDLVDLLLKAVNFDESVDRLFLVGDLADRGPKPIDSLRLLLRSYVEDSSIGNHEELLLGAIWEYLKGEGSLPSYFEYDPSVLVHPKNGGIWIFGDDFSENWYERLIKNHPDFSEIVDAIARLPFVLSIGEGQDRFNITHSELPDHWTDETIDQLPDFLPIEQAGKNTLGLSTFKGTIFKNYNNNMPVKKEGLSTTFTGHTVGNCVRKAFSHVCIDTGAFYSRNLLEHGLKDYKDYGLTIINAKTLHALTIDANNGITHSFHGDYLSDGISNKIDDLFTF